MADNIFSGTNNYRSALVAHMADYYSALRDEALVNIGMLVTLKIPNIENNVDEYSDYLDLEDSDYTIKQTYIEPKFDSYVKTLSLLGQDMEGDYPLSIEIMTNEHMPRNTIIIIQEVNSAYEAISREWRVLSTEIKQVGHIYTRMAYAVPARSFRSILGDVIFASSTVEAKVNKVRIYKMNKEDIIVNASSEVMISVLNCNVYKSYGRIDSYTETKAVVYKPQILD